MRRRFFWSLVAVAAVVLTVGGLAAALLINRSVDQSVRREFARQAETTARLIESVEGFRSGPRFGGGRGNPVVNPERTLGSLLAVVRAVGGHEYVEAVYVSADGDVTPLIDEPVLIEQIDDLTSVRRRMQFDATVDGGKVAGLAVPVEVGQPGTASEGTVIVVIGSDLDLVPWRDVVVRFGWALALGVALAALLAWSMSRWLSGRLEGLRGAARRLADGDLSARVPEEGEDEVTEVAEAFNEMASELQGAREREQAFLANISHDLRTPLTTITGYAEAMTEGRVGEDDLPRVAGVIDRESQRLARLVQDLLLLSRIEASEFTLQSEPVDLRAHLGGTVDAYKARAEQAGVTLATELGSFPVAHVDPDRVDQIVGNLLENALRYTPGGGSVTLSLSRDPDGRARIGVRDTGPGIQPDDLPHIFDRLYVAQHYRAERAEGSGLGLSIVKQLAERMGGTTEVESVVDVGTKVSVVIPVGSDE